MRIVAGYTAIPEEARGAAVALGNFDGVHRGHQAVIGEAGRIAGTIGAPHAALTFEPHPRRIMRPGRPNARLTPLRAKIRQIDALGVDYLVLLRFDKAFARQPAEVFVAQVLVAGLGVRHIVAGHDFAFGHKRRGDAALLARLATRMGFGFTQIDAVAGPDGVYSSTRVRDFLRAGNPAAAAAILGREWEIEGHVQRGEARGRLLGFPTANLLLGRHVRPALGVYAVRVVIPDGATERRYQGVANLGRRPTFGGEGVVFEVNIFDFDGDLYGRRIRVAIADYIRAEEKFDGIDALKAQIAVDAATARKMLAGP